MRILLPSQAVTLPVVRNTLRGFLMGLITVWATAFLPRIGHAQPYSIAEIDSIQALPYHAWGDDFEAMMLTQLETIQASEQLGHAKGIAIGYQLTATAMLAIGKYEEALRYADLAQKQRYTATDKPLQARLYNVYGRGYMALGFYQEASAHFDKAVRELEGTGPQHAEQLSNVYYNKAMVARMRGDLASEFETLQQLLRIYPLPTGHGRMAISYLDYKENPDSALHHLHAASKLLGRDSALVLIDAIITQSYGYYYEYQLQYDSALYHYHEALNLANKTNMPERVRLAYESLANAYERAGDRENALEYRTRYVHIDDSLKRAERRALSVPVEQFLRQKEKEYAQARLRMYLIFGGLLVLAILVIIGLRYTYLKKKAAREALLEAQADIIRQQQRETKTLEQKVNTAFDEVLQLAKENDSSFLTRFQEVYPEFIAKLMAISPKLVNTELNLCALIYLNLSSKDIARFTYIQPKSVQIRKYRLRKKLEIPQDADLHVWLQSLV